MHNLSIIATIHTCWSLSHDSYVRGMDWISSSEHRRLPHRMLINLPNGSQNINVSFSLTFQKSGTEFKFWIRCQKFWHRIQILNSVPKILAPNSKTSINLNSVPLFWKIGFVFWSRFQRFNIAYCIGSLLVIVDCPLVIWIQMYFCHLCMWVLL